MSCGERSKTLACASPPDHARARTRGKHGSKRAANDAHTVAATTRCSCRAALSLCVKAACVPLPPQSPQLCACFSLSQMFARSRLNCKQPTRFLYALMPLQWSRTCNNKKYLHASFIVVSRHSRANKVTFGPRFLCIQKFKINTKMPPPPPPPPLLPRKKSKLRAAAAAAKRSRSNAEQGNETDQNGAWCGGDEGRGGRGGG